MIARPYAVDIVPKPTKIEDDDPEVIRIDNYMVQHIGLQVYDPLKEHDRRDVEEGIAIGSRSKINACCGYNQQCGAI